jgi:hypothetical protein
LRWKGTKALADYWASASISLMDFLDELSLIEGQYLTDDAGRHFLHGESGGDSEHYLV